MAIDAVREAYESLLGAVRDPSTLALSVDTIAGQEYCEKQVDIARAVGDLPGPAEANASPSFEGPDMTDDAFWGAVANGERIRCTDRTFAAEIQGVLVGGRPDTVIFEDGRPRLVLGFHRTTSPDYLHAAGQLPVWLYGEILTRLGFETGDLSVGVLCHEGVLDDEAADRFYRTVLDTFEEWGYWQHELADGVVFHHANFPGVDRSDSLAWAMEYWHGERPPHPTPYRVRCRRCPYSDACPDSKA
jgi:hypothetical protein